jgi:hypothetical protein
MGTPRMVVYLEILPWMEKQKKKQTFGTKLILPQVDAKPSFTPCSISFV